MQVPDFQNQREAAQCLKIDRSGVNGDATQRMISTGATASPIKKSQIRMRFPRNNDAGSIISYRSL